MRTDFPAGFQDHLDSGSTTLSWCWKIERTDGVVLGFTNHDRPLQFDGVDFEASTGFLGSELDSRVLMSVDNMEVYGAVDSERIRESDIEAGLYDDASISVYLVNWEDVSQRILVKKGSVGNVKRGKLMFQAEVRGLGTQLQQTKGRSYQYPCDARLGDSRCGKDLSGPSFTKTGATVSLVNSPSSIVSGSLSAYEDKWFTNGKLTFTSGGNNGISREVKRHAKDGATSTLQFWEPFPFTIDPGDTFTVVAGCNQLLSDCKNKFDNVVNHRGFPHIPGSNTIIKYATVGGGVFDGGGYFLEED